MPFKYWSGEAVTEGDRVVYRGEPAKVDFVVTDISQHPTMEWYLEHFPGGGLLVTTDKGATVFVQHPEHDKDLGFVSRSRK